MLGVRALTNDPPTKRNSPKRKIGFLDDSNMHHGVFFFMLIVDLPAKDIGKLVMRNDEQRKNGCCMIILPCLPEPGMSQMLRDRLLQSMLADLVIQGPLL